MRARAHQQQARPCMVLFLSLHIFTWPAAAERECARENAAVAVYTTLTYNNIASVSVLVQNLCLLYRLTDCYRLTAFAAIAAIS